MEQYSKTIQSALYEFGFTEVEISNASETILELYSSKNIDLYKLCSVVAISLTTFTSLDSRSLFDILISSDLTQIHKVLPHVASLSCVVGLSYAETISMIESSPTDDYRCLRSILLQSLDPQ